MRATAIAIAAMIASGPALAGPNWDTTEWIIKTANVNTGQLPHENEIDKACDAAYAKAARQGDHTCRNHFNGEPTDFIEHGSCLHENVGLPGAGFGFSRSSTITVCENVF